MASALPLRAALFRGALLTAANWPIVVVEFTIESLYKLALAVPVVGGAFMVAVLLGADVRVLFDEGLRSAAERIASSLDTAPVALGAYLAAVGLVAFGGGVLLFVVKSGTLSTLVRSDLSSGELQRGPITLAAVRGASAYDPRHVLASARALAGRAFMLTVWLTGGYALVAGAYVLALGAAVRVADSAQWAPAWPLVVLVATSSAIVAIGVVNLAFDLVRVIVVTEDCDVLAAVGRLRRFVIQDARQVLGIFGVVTVVVLVATAASVLTAAGLTVVAWVPFAGFISMPLRAAAWLIQGLLFQYVALTALSAYQTQYRRFTEPRADAAALLERA